MNPILITGALLGFLSVAIGAAADHALRGSAEPAALESLMTALRYHQLGALIISMIGLALWAQPRLLSIRWLPRAGWLFVAGTVLFSFSIYASVLTGMRALTFLTPVGGVTLMAAWLALAWAAFGGGRPANSAVTAR
ncbi:MAG: DUF423 domain-containing protein [Wenzhouxiangellaceae bacterium]|nr:DUF423 domain-containing protein [Wenzhouxiangellaceae bacterium]